MSKDRKRLLLVENKLVVTAGEGAREGWGSERHKPLGVRQTQECIVHHGEYNQVFIIRVTGR